MKKNNIPLTIFSLILGILLFVALITGIFSGWYGVTVWNISSAQTQPLPEKFTVIEYECSLTDKATPNPKIDHQCRAGELVERSHEFDSLEQAEKYDKTNIGFIYYGTNVQLQRPGI